MTAIRATALFLTVCGILALAASVPAAQRDNAARDKAKADAPTVVGKVAAYEAGKSITIETKRRNEEAKKTEFAIVKDKTKIELPQGKSLEVGMTVSVWADKDNPKQAAKITVAGAGARPGR